MIFTDIDEKDPSLMFYFFLQIQGASRKYVGKYVSAATTLFTEAGTIDSSVRSLDHLTDNRN